MSLCPGCLEHVCECDVLEAERQEVERMNYTRKGWYKGEPVGVRRS